METTEASCPGCGEFSEMSVSRTSSTAWGQVVETGAAPQGVSWTERTSGSGHEPIFAEKLGPMPCGALP